MANKFQTNTERADSVESIAGRAEEQKVRDGLELEAEQAAEAQVEAEAPATEVVEQPQEQPVEAVAAPQFDLSAKITRKVNGQDVTRTVEEWIAAGQKTDAADRYLADAAKAFRTQQQTAQEAQPAAAPAKVEEDDLALARAIQTGTEEEARAAVSKLRKQPQAVTPEQLLPLVDQRLAVLDALRTFQSEFKDVVSDPNLLQLVQAEDQRLIQAGHAGSNLERFREAGNNVRKWREGLTSLATTEKQQRKASVTPVQAASGRASAAAKDEDDDSPSSVISQMARDRMGRFAGKQPTT